jgi:hypothetical protein
LQDTLEDLELESSCYSSECSMTAVTILSTFKNLRSVILMTGLLRLMDFFTKGDQNGVVEEEQVRLKPWACKDLRFLRIQIEGDSWDWCPPGVVHEQDDYIRADPPVGWKDYRATPLYDMIMARLESYPKLDHSNVRYTYE